MPKTTPTQYLFIMASLNDGRSFVFRDDQIPSRFEWYRIVPVNVDVPYETACKAFCRLLHAKRLQVMRPENNILEGHDPFMELPASRVHVTAQNSPRKKYVTVKPLVVVIEGCTLRGLEGIYPWDDHELKPKLNLRQHLLPLLQQAA